MTAARTARCVPVPGTGWSLWPTAMVRGAGFPAHAAGRLADERLAALADRLGPEGAGDPGYARAWADAAARTTRELAAVAASERFRLAVGWQNPRFLDTAVEPLLRHAADGPPNSRGRTREQAVATYWQRYCLKNESIGFFGPVSWATVAGHDDGTVLRAEPGPGFVDGARVCLERWVVETLARTLADRFDLRPWLRPRRNPLLRFDGHRAGLPDDDDRPVGPVAAAVLSAADGRTTARALAAALCARPDLPVRTEAAAFAAFERLRRDRWLVWRLELPASETAEDDLLALLGAVDDPEVRAATTAPVAELVAARDRLHAVWDRPDAVRRETARLGEAFHRLTGAAPTRDDGRAYAGRTAARLECRRDLDVHVGARFVAALRPVGGVLDSLRWLTWRIRAELHPVAVAAYRAAAARGPGRVDVATFWGACTPLLGGRADAVVRAAVAELHARWERALGDRTTWTAAELEPRLAALFDAPGPGWTQARLSCPDVLVAARDGRYTAVLGEVHAAMNSADYLAMVPSHREPHLLYAGLDAGFPEPRLLPVPPPESRPRSTVRSYPALVRDGDVRLALLPRTPLPQTGVTVLAADASVHERDGDLVVTVPGHDGAFDVFDLFAETLKALLMRHVRLFPVRGYRPRIVVDDVVLARAGWRVPVAQAGFATVADPARRFAAARRWAAGLGLPRHVFVASPVEVKPFHVDLAAPVLVDVLATCLRRTARDDPGAAVTVTEMTPGPDELWLTGPDGAPVTSELRFVALDRRAGHPFPRTTREEPPS